VKNRIEWIDTAKGLGIFLVVLGHALPAGGMFPAIIWTFHMPLFFFLSGLTAKGWAPGSGSKFFRGLKVLVIPYIFFSLISIILWLTSQRSLSSVETWVSQLQQMAYGVAGPEKKMGYNVPLWFFTCLLSVRIIFAALTSAVQSKLLQYICVILMAAIAHGYVFSEFNSIIWNFDVALVALVFFATGYTLQGINITSFPSVKAMRWAAGFAAFLLFCACVAVNGRVDMNGRVFGDPIFFYLGAFSGIALMLQVAGKLDQVTALKTLGRASIVIFPVHALFWLLPSKFYSVITWYASKIAHSDIFVSVIVSAIEITVSMLVYFAIIRWAPFLIGQSARPKSPVSIDARHSGGASV
jgi:fucose 4-O-acetylase-like acetyltransferase